MADMVKMTYGDGKNELELKFDMDSPDDVDMMLDLIVMHVEQTDGKFYAVFESMF